MQTAAACGALCQQPRAQACQAGVQVPGQVMRVSALMLHLNQERLRGAGTGE